VARDREVPRREFLWPGASGLKTPRRGREKRIFHGKPRMANPFEFMQQVRAEASKVIWPTRRETLITTGMVLLMVVFASLFFVTVDAALHYLVGLVLGIGRHG
jgi:preprotein translocase subunit SecE